MSSAQTPPDPEIIPPGRDHSQDHSRSGAKTAGGFDDLGEQASAVLRHPMTWPRAAYFLYALSIFTGLPMLVGLIVAYVARAEAPHWQQTHYTFLIRTFWYFIALVAIGVALVMAFGLGLLLIWVLPLWVAIRVIRGWLLLENTKPVPEPESWFFG